MNASATPEQVCSTCSYSESGERARKGATQQEQQIDSLPHGYSRVWHAIAEVFQHHLGMSGDQPIGIPASSSFESRGRQVSLDRTEATRATVVPCRGIIRQALLDRTEATRATVAPGRLERKPSHQQVAASSHRSDTGGSDRNACQPLGCLYHLTPQQSSAMLPVAHHLTALYLSHIDTQQAQP